MADQPCYTLINIPLDAETPSEMKLREDLEKGDLPTKIEALKKTIMLIVNGEKMPTLLMTVVKFVMPLRDHMVKKLLLVFWEVVPKYNSEGKLLHEMILVCDAYRKDLQHPNEFIRGSTLRFLCKLKEAELLEPLMPAIRACLSHKHAYVRRNATLAIFTIYQNFNHLISDAPELIGKYLEEEQDASCKRNAFMMLIQADRERALNYLSSCIDQVNSFNDILQLVIVELIYKVCHSKPMERARFIRCVYNLLNSESPAVRYEAAGTLVTLSSAPTAIKAAASCYIDLIMKESDNNVKLIVLDRLIELKAAHERVLSELVMDVLRVLSASDLEVRRKTLSLALDLVTSRTAEEMILVLRKEVIRTGDSDGNDMEEIGKYRQLLVRTLHQASSKFPDLASVVIPVLIDFLGDKNELAATDTLVFIREAIDRFESVRPLVIERMRDGFSGISSVGIFRSALWILGEYSTSVEDIQGVMTIIRQSLGDLPIVEDEIRLAHGEGDEAVEQQTGQIQTLVTADGTYATQTALSTVRSLPTAQRPLLRRLLISGDFFTGAALSTVLTKLGIRFCEKVRDSKKQNVFLAEAMLIMASIIHYGRSGMPEKGISDDDVDRISTCLRAVADRSPEMTRIFNSLCRKSLSALLVSKKVEQENFEHVSVAKVTEVKVQPDDPIGFSQLNPMVEGGTENLFELTLSAALGSNKKRDLGSNKLSKVTQLSGFSDPVYAEAYVNVNQYDIVLDVLIVNQTGDTLQNLTLELSCLGDLKLVEKPSSITMGPHDFSNIKASVKVSSTENGIIFGNIVYDVRGSDRNCVVLSEIHIDIMDYIVPAICTDSEFRQMWISFEWENKVTVNTNIVEMREYLEHLISSTNMHCLTPDKALVGECGFMAANLYAKSIFGEHALANVSIEKALGSGPRTTVTGHIRIRAKSQGMALSLGDKINLSHKKVLKPGEIKEEA